jgi:hypothetical protein
MPTYTTTYNLGKPVVGADEDAWGDTLNASLDSLDGILDGTTPVTGIDINSGTIDGVVIGGATPAAGTFTTLTANTSITGTLATAAQPNITSVGTLTGLTVSASASLAGASTTADITFGDNDKAIFGAGSDLQIYHDGTNSYVSDQGDGDLYLRGSFNVRITDLNNHKMALFQDGGSAHLYYDGGTYTTPKLATTATGVDITGTLSSDGLTVDGPAVISNTNFDTLYLRRSSTSAATFIMENSNNNGGALQADDNGLRLYTRTTSSFDEKIRLLNNGDITFYDTSGNASFVYDESAGSTFNEQGDNKDFRVESDSNTHMLFVDASENAVAIGSASTSTASRLRTAASSVATGDSILLVDSANDANIIGNHVHIKALRGDNSVYNLLTIENAGGEILNISGSGSVVFNESGGDRDFRVESDNQSHMLFVDAANDKVGIATVPSSRLHIKDTNTSTGSTNPPHLRIEGNNGLFYDIGRDNAGTGFLSFYGNQVNANGYIFGGANGERMRINADGTMIHQQGAVFNEGSTSQDFRVESDTNTHMLFVDAGNSRVGIGTSSPSVALQVSGSAIQVGTGTAGQINVWSSDYNIQGGTNYGDMRFNAPRFRFYEDSTLSAQISGTTFIAQKAATINEDGGDHDFRVESDNNSNMLFVDAGGDKVVVGTTPSGKFGPAPLQVGSFGIRTMGVSNTATSSNISVNAGGNGMTALVMANRNTGAGTATVSAVYMLQFYYDGNNTPAVTHISGSNFITFGQNGSNELTLTNPAGGNCNATILMNG